MLAASLAVASTEPPWVALSADRPVAWHAERCVDDWVVEQFKSVDGTQATQAVLTFIKRHAPRVSPRASVTPDSPPVSLESLTVLLKVLHKFSSPYPQLAQQIVRLPPPPSRAA